MNEKGECEKCGPSKEVVDGTCICERKFIQVEDRCRNCQENGGYLRNNVCYKCPDGWVRFPEEDYCVPLNEVEIATEPQSQISSKKIEISSIQNTHQSTPDKAISLDKKAVCGNGFIEEDEECDDRNT